MAALNPLRRKRAVWAIVILGLVTGWLYFSIRSSIPLDRRDCAFCNDEILDRQTFYDDGQVMGLYTHKPLAEGHCLIIPKGHAQRFEQLSAEQITAMGQLIKKVHRAVEQVYGTSNYFLLQKNGLSAGQTVPHVHFHYVPRPDNDSTLPILFKFATDPLRSPISREAMQENVGRLQAAIAEQPDV